MPPGRFSIPIGWPRRGPSFSASARMKTSLSPPGLVVVRTRIGRVGQSCAAAPPTDAAKAKSVVSKSVASKSHDERRTDVISLGIGSELSIFCRRRARSGDPVAVGGEAEQPLDAIVARRARLRDPPLVGAAGREFPVIGRPGLVAIVDLQHFGGVFERHLVGTAEIGKDVVARPVAAGAPLDRIAVIF